MEENRSDLYHPLLLEYNRAPEHYEKRPEATVILEASNPLCGDKFVLYLDVENGVVVRASFYGHGCAVSKASASVLMRKIQGRPVAEIRLLLAVFLQLLCDTSAAAVAPDADFAIFLPVRQYQERLGCATLAWETLDQFFRKN